MPGTWDSASSAANGPRRRRRRISRPSPTPPRLSTDDPVADFAKSRSDVLTAFGEPGVVEKTGPALGIAFSDQLLHGWDLARATGQDYRVADATAARLLALVREYAQMYRDYKGFGEPVEVPAGTGDLETAVALSGRDPYWAG